ncbi:MAG: hypothetical protein ACHRXM_11680 [Isosphaerales bacterium]
MPQKKALGHSDAVLNAVDEIANKTSDTKEDVLLKALSLYEAAIDAKRKNQRLVLVGPEYQFIREIVGFDELKREFSQHATAAG